MQITAVFYKISFIYRDKKMIIPAAFSEKKRASAGKKLLSSEKKA